MMAKSSSDCEAVTLKPVKTSVSHIPPFPGAQETELPFTLDADNDPGDYRCALVKEYGDLTSGKWKHYLTEEGWENAYSIYKKVVRDADWIRRLDSSGDTLKVILYGKEQNSLYRNLLVFIAPRENGAHILAGYRITK
jgi:hypothetical protein